MHIVITILGQSAHRHWRRLPPPDLEVALIVARKHQAGKPSSQCAGISRSHMASVSKRGQVPKTHKVLAIVAGHQHGRLRSVHCARERQYAALDLLPLQPSPRSSALSDWRPDMVAEIASRALPRHEQGAYKDADPLTLTQRYELEAEERLARGQLGGRAL